MASIETTSGALGFFNRYALRYDLAQTLERIKTVSRNPSSDSDLAVILVACIALAVAIVVILLLIIITPSQRTIRKTRTYRLKPGQEPPPPREPSIRDELNTTRERPPSQLFLILTGNVALLVIAALGLAGVYFATSTDRYCSETCHRGSTAIVDAADARHAHCIQCHEGPLLLASVSNSLGRVRMAAGSALDASVANGPSVDSSRCLSCHRDKIAKGVLVGDKGIAMSHAELLAAGVPCTRCHRRTGHDRGASTARMSDCITCHDDTTASAECDTCHRKDPSATAFKQDSSGRVAGTGNIAYPAVRAARRECGLCHDEAKSCDPCHGIRMPHSKEFVEGGHAMPAAFERKLKCYKCHDPAECGRCHSGFNPKNGDSSHGADWKAEHKRSSWRSGCVCHSTHSPRTQPICSRCHPDHYAK
ncbi:MAG TPA: cytochrome c3 family protein [Coriobacteriia bacterium]|nr:cytochrome c3 family protein [Coriobacteriia bacterium]